MKAEAVKRELSALGSAKKAKASAWFFKTGPGQYGEGDVFIGVSVPEQRKVAKRYLKLPMQEVEALLQSPEHEFRLTALIIWVQQFAKGNEATQRSIYQFYLANTRWVNNWDLVDTSAAQIVGGWTQGRDRGVLERLAESEHGWERRIAIIASMYYLKTGDYGDTLKIADMLLHDEHDLIRKAVGWALREVGKRCGREVLVGYLAHRYNVMPRTMLRYAIEHFPQEERRAYLAGDV